MHHYTMIKSRLESTRHFLMYPRNGLHSFNFNSFLLPSHFLSLPVFMWRIWLENPHAMFQHLSSFQPCLACVFLSLTFIHKYQLQIYLAILLYKYFAYTGLCYFDLFARSRHSYMINNIMSWRTTLDNFKKRKK